MRKMELVEPSYAPDETVPYVYRRTVPAPSAPAEVFAAAICAGLMVLAAFVAVVAFGG